jgi:hypothetical protein
MKVVVVFFILFIQCSGFSVTEKTIDDMKFYSQLQTFRIIQLEEKLDSLRTEFDWVNKRLHNLECILAEKNIISIGENR